MITKGHSMKTRMRMAAVVASAAIVLSACSSASPGPTPSSVAPGARPSSTASLSIVTPTPGDTIHGPVEVKLDLTGATLTKVVSTNLKPNEGHVHLRLDGRTITLLGSLDESIPDVALGPHLLEAEFVASDHGPFNPRVIARVTFTEA